MAEIRQVEDLNAFPASQNKGSVFTVVRPLRIPPYKIIDGTYWSDGKVWQEIVQVSTMQPHVEDNRFLRIYKNSNYG